MTDRLQGFTVVLDHTVREDDAEFVRDAILMVKGVQDVRPIVADILSDSVAIIRERNRIEGRIRDLFQNLDGE